MAYYDGPIGPNPKGKELEEGAALSLDWNKLDKVAAKKCNVVPVVVQDSRNGSVLICAYVNEISLAESFKRRVACFWSTSRNELWVKGATSGDTLILDDVRINCEQNSLLFLVTPENKGACHTKDASQNSRPACYYRRVTPSLKLEHIVTPSQAGSNAFRESSLSIKWSSAAALVVGGMVAGATLAAMSGRLTKMQR